jgi:hypothetical protein
MSQSSPAIIQIDIQKLNYIESLISSTSSSSSSSSKCIRELEILISNLIDYTYKQKFSEADKCRILIKENQPDKYDKIMYAANSIIYNYDLVIG